MTELEKQRDQPDESEDVEELKEERKLDFPYRIDWYQTDVKVVVTVFRKKENLGDKYGVIFTDNTASITVKTEEGQEYDKVLFLEKRISPDKSSSSVFPSKVEIKMWKAELGPWKHFEAVRTDTGPTKSKKNWDEVAKEIEEDKVEGEALLNKFFGDIYTNGSDEVKKAMIKSFTESGGTELSTNWDQVSQDRVTIKPPEGMEWKPWDA